MNINFHYFAIKVLAIKAGFKEDDAQKIAFYSQAVDDYDIYTPILVENIPSYAQYLSKKVSDKWLFSPVTTGFSNWFDYARLVLESNQRSITIPFHFIPTQKLTIPVSSRTEYRVRPGKMSTPSLIRDMLVEARDMYIKSSVPTNLIRIGILLHTFADTYAHQNFSGFWGWENNAKLTFAVDSSDLQDTYEPPKNIKIPPVGHANLNQIPDIPNLTYSWEQKCSGKDSYSISYTRNNIEEFCSVSLEILNYLLSCNKQLPISENAWKELIDDVKKGFCITEKEVSKLADHWHIHFPNIKFYYEKDELFKTNDDFFQFNVYADEIRREVNDVIDKEINFNNYIMQVSDDDAQLNRLATFQTNN